MRIILPLCAVILIFIDSITSLTEDVGRECDSDSECLPSTDCESYQEEIALWKSLSRIDLNNLKQKYRKLVCNKKERGICCSVTKDCGKSQSLASNVSFIFFITLITALNCQK